MIEPTDFRDMALQLDGCCEQVGQLVAEIQRRTTEAGASADLEVLVESPLARLTAAVQQLQSISSEWRPELGAVADVPPVVDPPDGGEVAEHEIEPASDAEAETEVQAGGDVPTPDPADQAAWTDVDSSGAGDGTVAEYAEPGAEPESGYEASDLDAAGEPPASSVESGPVETEPVEAEARVEPEAPVEPAAYDEAQPVEAETYAEAEAVDAEACVEAEAVEGVATAEDPESAQEATDADASRPPDDTPAAQEDGAVDAEPADGARAGRRAPGSMRGAGRCALRGFSASLPIPSLLELLSSHRKSGTLRITTAQETFTLEIQEGDLVHACTDSSRADQLLGSILVARDSIDPDQLEEFFKQFMADKTAPDKIGEALERAQLVSRTDLKHALEHQVQELFHRLFAADHAAFYFYEGGENIEQRIRLNVTRLLLESARTRDESMARMA